jgi:hypothetical protein
VVHHPLMGAPLKPTVLDAPPAGASAYADDHATRTTPQKHQTLVEDKHDNDIDGLGSASPSQKPVEPSVSDNTSAIATKPTSVSTSAPAHDRGVPQDTPSTLQNQ